MNRLKVLLIVKKKDKFSDQLINFLKSKKVNLKYLFTEDKNTKLFKKCLNNWSGDLLFSFRNRYIFKKKFLKKNIKIAAINFHSGPPEYRGVGCANYAIFEKKKNYGVTAHLIDEKIDTGKILQVRRFKIHKSWNLKKLLEKTHKELLIISKNIIKLFCKNNKKLIGKLQANHKDTWSKKIYTLRKLNKLYEIKKYYSKEKMELIIKATKLDNFRPYIKVKNLKFYYVN